MYCSLCATKSTAAERADTAWTHSWMLISTFKSGKSGKSTHVLTTTWNNNHNSTVSIRLRPVGLYENSFDSQSLASTQNNTLRNSIRLLDCGTGSNHNLDHNHEGDALDTIL